VLKSFVVYSVSMVLAWGQPVSTVERSPGYLTSAQTASVVNVVPPAPLAGDARYEADMAIFHSTRSFEGSPRWTLAQSDDKLSIPAVMETFRCALGLALTPEKAPKLAKLIARAYSDAGAAANVIKVRYQHKRPFQIAEGNVCLSTQGKAALEKSPDYPSGHTALSWETGLILAELVPDAAIDILARARAFGQSRVVCGVHNASAVEAGWMTSTVVFALQQSSPAFHADLEAARSELAALRADAKPKSESCVLESKTLSENPY
jgi:acid phosphatase (class A)